MEHNKCPFLVQNVLVDLSISFLNIKHLNIGDILIINFLQEEENNLIYLRKKSFICFIPNFPNTIVFI